MAKFRLIFIIISILYTTITLSQALFEDQAGKFDWKCSYIGRVQSAQFKDSRIIVTTQENVLASLNTQNGNIHWRQVLEDSEEHKIHHLHVDKEVTTVSGTDNSWFVRGWDLSTGVLLWEWTFYTENHQNSLWFVNELRLMHVVRKDGSLEVTVYNLKTGENNGKTTKIYTPFLNNKSKCVLTQSYFVCLSGEPAPQMYYLDVLSNSEAIFTRPQLSLIGTNNENVEIFSLETNQAAVVLKWEHFATALIFSNNEIEQKVNILPNSVGVTGIDGVIYQLDVNTSNSNNPIMLKTQHLNQETEHSAATLNYPLGLGAPFSIAAHCGQECVILLLGTDNSLSLFDAKTGNVKWTREEALSNIVAVEFFELPVSELDASIENEFKTSSNDVLNMFLHRLSTQMKQLENFLFGSREFVENPLVRDEFGLHKMIVVVTNVGKLFGIDTITGTIIWSYRLPNVRPFQMWNKQSTMLLVQRTARYAPFPAQAVLLAQDVTNGNGVLFQFDPITGLSNAELKRFDFKIKQAYLLTHEDENHLKPLIIISNNNEIYIYPENLRNLVNEHASETYFYTIESTLNVLKGYHLLNEAALNVELMWEMSLGPSELVAISTRPAAERVHSQGRVLADRSVYYKYVNPNLIALATLTEDPSHKHVLSVYLIDGVTGFILYSTSHKRARGPVHLVHSENWLVYSFFNERFRRHEIASAELFEGYIQSNSTVFSSYAVSQLPHVQTQSFILPSTPLTMAVTLTERGITNKCLLIALNNGAVTEVPWMLVQPRFADACGPEESCIPYMPEIPLLSEATINYNQTLAKVKKIEVAPARLESTIHVLVHGLDLFYTRVAPSKTFDVLKDDFDHRLIVLVLGGLIIVTYISKYLAARKILRQTWK